MLLESDREVSSPMRSSIPGPVPRIGGKTDDGAESAGGLIDALRIDREEEPSRRTGVARAVFVGLAIAGALGLAFHLGAKSPEWDQAAKPRDPAHAKGTSPPSTDNSAKQSAGLEASGYVIARRQATVSAEATGRVTEVNVDEGSFVKRGQVLAELDARAAAAELAYSEAQFRAAAKDAELARLKLDDARRKLARTLQLGEKGFASKAQVENATYEVSSAEAQVAASVSAIEVAAERTALPKQQLRNTKILAPFDGVVTKLAAQVGEIVSPVSAVGGFTRTGICTIVDLTSLEGEVSVNEQYIGRVRMGQPVLVKSHAYPELRIKGDVIQITSAVERETAAVKVRVAFRQLDPRLIPAMRIDVTFLAPDS